MTQLINLRMATHIDTEGYDVLVHFTDGKVCRIVGHNMTDLNRGLAAVRTALLPRSDGWIEQA
jgi:hypothetical protein